MSVGREGIEARFEAYVSSLSEVIGHADRAAPLRDYCMGLVLPGERKSVEPMAAVTAPSRVAAQHQSLLHFVGASPWSDDRVIEKVRERVQPALEQHGPIEAWIIDDTSFSKKGRHSVGVARQYCGQLGKQDNCQVAVSLSIANHGASLPISFRLYLPQEWVVDAERRRKAGVPEEIAFRTKPEIALSLLRDAIAADVPRGIALLDAGYGNNTRLRTEITALGLPYVAGILSNTSVWTVDAAKKPSTAKRRRREAADAPIQVKALAHDLSAETWQTVTWREGSADWLTSRFARVRVRAAHHDPDASSEHRVEEWLLIEWPAQEREPTKYWLSTLPEDVAFDWLVDRAKLRWRIERDYQELKQEVGLGHYEGRSWRGFHHHATLCIAAYGFLISERETIPPSATRSSAPPAISHSPKLSTPRRHRSELRDTSRTPSRPCGSFSSPLSPGDCRAAPAAPPLDEKSR
jgi:SRSO17 transposase